MSSALRTRSTTLLRLIMFLVLVLGHVILTARTVVASIESFRDTFGAVAYDNDDGTLPWSGAWAEVGESTDPENGTWKVTNDDGFPGYAVEKTGGAGNGIVRSADLDGFTSATLKFAYRRQALVQPKSVVVQVSASGPEGPWTTVHTITGAIPDATDLSYQTVSVDITEYISSTTSVRFMHDERAGAFGARMAVFIDDVEISVEQTNRAPVLVAIGGVSGDEGTEIGFVASATDPDGDGLAFSLDGEVPVGASITPDGVFSWVPDESHGPGSYGFDLVVSDTGSPVLTASETITVTVAEVNVAPVLVPLEDRLDAEKAMVSLPLQATDPDLPASEITWLSSGLPPGLMLGSDGEISGTVEDSAAAGSPYVVTVEVADDSGLSDQATFTWAITDTDPPSPPADPDPPSEPVSPEPSPEPVNPDPPPAPADPDPVPEVEDQPDDGETTKPAVSPGAKPEGREAPNDSETTEPHVDPVPEEDSEADDSETTETTETTDTDGVSVPSLQPADRATVEAAPIPGPDEEPRVEVESIVMSPSSLGIATLTRVLDAAGLLIPTSSELDSVGDQPLLRAMSLFTKAFFQTILAMDIPTLLLGFTAITLVGLRGVSRHPVLLNRRSQHFWAVVMLGRERRLAVYDAPDHDGSVIYKLGPATQGLRGTGLEELTDGVRWVGVSTPAGEGWVDGSRVTEQVDATSFLHDGRPREVLEDFLGRLRSNRDVSDLVSDRGLVLVLGELMQVVDSSVLTRLVSDPTDIGTLSGGWSPRDFHLVVVSPLLDAYAKTPVISPHVAHAETSLLPAAMRNFRYLALGGPGTRPWLVFFEYTDGKPKVVGMTIDE